ncbi:MAG: acyl carrier protein [bacterium]
MDIRATLRAFLRENFLLARPGGELCDETSFLDSGLVDSTGMLEIVQFLEERFGMTVEDEELAPENLDSIENLTRFVCRKTGRADGLAGGERPIDSSAADGRPREPSTLAGGVGG